MGGGEGLGPILNLTLAGKRRAEKCWYLGLAIYSPLVAARINSVLSPGLLFQLLMNSSSSATTCRLIPCLLCPLLKRCFLPGLDPLWVSGSSLAGADDSSQSLVSLTWLLSLEGKQSAVPGVFVSAAWEKTVLVKLKLLCLLCFSNSLCSWCRCGESACPFGLFHQGVCPAVFLQSV